MPGSQGEGSLPPQAPAYDMRTGQPLSSSDGQRPYPDDLGFWDPAYTPPEPAWGTLPPVQTATDVEAQSPYPETGLGQVERRRPLVLLAALVAAAVVSVAVAVAVFAFIHDPKRSTSAPAARNTNQPAPTAAAVLPPSSTPSSAPSAPTRHAKVLALNVSQTVTYGGAGPSIDRNASGQLTKYPALTTPVLVGSYLDIICTVYGSNTSLGALGTGTVWDYTAYGWFTDRALLTNSQDPVANACVGNIADPTEGNTPPSVTAGPFPIYSRGQTVAVRTDPQAGDIGDELQDGDLVTLVCTANGPPVLSPNDLTGQPIGSSTQWDKISAPIVGWVPDAMINSASENSVAPIC